MFDRAGRAAAYLVFAVVAVLSWLPGRAFAQSTSGRTTPLHVIEIDSDDAEDQAEALTSALRTRVRASSQFTLLETTQTLSTLVVALRCPPKPDGACLQRIADQIRGDRFIWGMMTKAPGNQVTADVHLWTRGKGDVAIKETFSDNLKDPADESLRRIASRQFDKLVGNPLMGFLVVQAPSGKVFIDDIERGPVQAGQARFELPSGTYVVEVRAADGSRGSQSATVAAGGETTVSVAMVAPKPDEVPAKATPAPSMSGQRIAGYITLGVGGALLVPTAIAGAMFLSNRADLDDYRALVPNTVTDVCDAESDPNAVLACRSYKSASNARTWSYIFGGASVAAIATGIILVVTAPSNEAPAANAPRTTDGKTAAVRWNVAPFFSGNAGGVAASGTF